MAKWKNASAFVELAFSIDKYLPGYVDAYFGPDEIRASVGARGKIHLEELSAVLDQIIASTRQDTSITNARREYLSAELNAMRTTLRLFQGEKIDIVAEAQGLYGLSPAWIEESVFAEAHRALEALLPGPGALKERLDSFRESTMIPGDRIVDIGRRIAEELRRRTKGFAPLPEGESCDFSLVRDKPWAAYNWYLGEYRSRIEINTDLPIPASFILHFMAHEAYPGHHTEHAMKEKLLYREAGYLEHSILLSNTPSAVVSEGIAEIASEIFTTPDEMVRLLQVIIDQAGLQGVAADRLYQITKAGRLLDKVMINQILMFYDRGASDEEVTGYGMKFGLQREPQSRKFLEMIKDPLWRSYGFLYPMGYELVKGFVSREGSVGERFLRLLQEPVTTTQLLN